MRRERTTLYFDGGWRPVAGQMEIAVVVAGETHVRADLGAGCNETAEWLALLFAVELAVQRGAGDVLFVGDSANVVAQALGRQRCRTPQLQQHLAAFRAATGGFTRIHLKHVRRSKNLAGIALATRHR